MTEAEAPVIRINEVEQVEERLWGISRREAGSTAISPSWITVGQPVDLLVRYFVGPRGLPPGIWAFT